MTSETLPADRPDLADKAVALARQWLVRADDLETSRDRAQMNQLEGIVLDPDGVALVMQFVDRVIRPESNADAAHQLRKLVATKSSPAFMNPLDRLLLKAGAFISPLAPWLVMPLAKQRMRMIVGHLVVSAEQAKLERPIAAHQAQGYATNINLLSEAVLGQAEADHRFQKLLDLVAIPDVDYVSVKVSGVAPQLNHWAHDATLARITARLSELVRQASKSSPVTFINLDMEEYYDMRLTLDAFMSVYGQPENIALDGGIVIQTYLPESLPALQELVGWANQRFEAGGGTTKIRLVKGANLGMERVHGAIHGWEQAPYETKAEVDANFKHCLDWVLKPELMAGVRIGVATHNIFDTAAAHLLADARGVSAKIQFEMLQGMAPSHAAAVTEGTMSDSSLLLYTPVVEPQDFDVAIGYLFRRLEETAAPGNFLRDLFGMTPTSAQFEAQEQTFRSAMAAASSVSSDSRRTQNRLAPPSRAYEVGQPFENEPETDTSLDTTHMWIKKVMDQTPSEPHAPVTSGLDNVADLLSTARDGFKEWSATTTQARQAALHCVADELSERRGDLVTAMMYEGKKTFPEADGEINEAIDFARYYADSCLDLKGNKAAEFSPLGVVAVIPPWNFPVAIPIGGVLAALAAGNAAILKPAPETPRCAEIAAECCWAGGIPPHVLQFVRLEDGDEGKALVVGADAVILTGAAETAALFRSWKPDLRLFAETSGKNALIVTPNADLDLAAEDLAQSAFGHSGQKCSAASIAILVGTVYKSERFLRQLADAVESLAVGSTSKLDSTMGPIISPAGPALHRGLTELDEGETWLVKPELEDGDSSLWSPGVRMGVQPGSWFHRTECFGPVLGLIRAETLQDAIAIQNSSDFGLTGGIHSLDPAEIATWIDEVEVGNGYVNRSTTGAIVQRQPFGGWKKSCVGPGAKAGGPNYLSQLGTWRSTSDGDDFQHWWDEHFSQDHDPSGLFCETNIFRYRPYDKIGLRVGHGVDPSDLVKTRKAASICGVTIVESQSGTESDEAFVERLVGLGIEHARILGGPVSAPALQLAALNNLHLADDPVTGFGRIELQHFLREQAISTTIHRFGNLTA